MTKKGFNAVAAAIVATKPSEQDILMQTGEYNQWKRTTKAIAMELCDVNDKFDYHQFLTACGYPKLGDGTWA